MTNFHDLKVRALSPKEREIATETLAAWLYAWSDSFDYDNATIADARIVAASMMAEAASLCEDEGCPQAGTVHVCVTRRPPPCPGCGRVPFGEEPCPTVGCLESFAHRVSPAIAEEIIEKINRPEGVKLISGGYERGDGSIAWGDPETEPGEHSEVLAAIEAHNTGEEE